MSSAGQLIPITGIDNISPALCTPITPFPADPICSERGSHGLIPSAA